MGDVNRARAQADAPKRVEGGQSAPRSRSRASPTPEGRSPADTGVNGRAALSKGFVAHRGTHRRSPTGPNRTPPAPPSRGLHLFGRIGGAQGDGQRTGLRPWSPAYAGPVVTGSRLDFRPPTRPP